MLKKEIKETDGNNVLTEFGTGLIDTEEFELRPGSAAKCVTTSGL
jgi:hypothetical protein